MPKPVSEVLYRTYNPADLEAIVELDLACFEPPFRFSRPAMRRFVEAGNAWITIAESNTKLAGFCIVHREHAPAVDIGYVVTIDVAEPFRRSGVAAHMLAEGESWVRSFNGGGMLLHVYLKNAAAITFYDRMGYKRISLQTSFYGDGLDAAMYWKDLSRR
jgi:[ribosomal protein S18]-alanine N-acetyltransferase